MTTYVGGKKVIGKEIADVLMQIDPKGPGKSQYWEPFVGMCGVMQWMKAPVRIGTDLHHEVISMWQALQNGWVPPTQCLTKKQYEALKINIHADPALRAYVGHGHSFSGMYFGAYKPNFSEYDKGCNNRAFDGVMNALQNMRDVHFFATAYDTVKMPCSLPLLVYCDPPYAGSKLKIGGLDAQPFDSESFWNWARQMSVCHIVAVSETTAPPDFIRIWNKDRHLKISAKAGEQKRIEEGLFVHKDVAKRLRLTRDMFAQ